jgi:hypothetical protein
MRVFFVNVFLATLILLFSNSLFGQQLTGGLSGTATDSTGATVPGAAVELKNMDSGDVRVAKTNGDGFFAIPAVQPGKYSVKITAAGFATWQEDGIVVTQGASLAVPNIVLKVGSTKTEVEVISEGAAAVAADTGAVSTTLNQTMVDEFTLSGRDAGELIKIMPGMGQNNGLSGNASFNGADHVTGSNAGPAGSYSANGLLPHGSMAYMLDGANLVDNNMGTQIANINPEMVSEVKFQTSSYGAEFAKGPTVFQAFSKSGGKGFHGEGYLMARNSIFNAEDSFQKAEGNANTVSHYYYPGGNIGGPLTIPGHFNRNRDKLFFWFGYEYMNQQPAGSLVQYFVPTPQMKAGNFSPAYLSSIEVGGNAPSGWNNAFTQPCANATAGGCANLTGIAGGMIPQSLFDANGSAYMKLMPAANLDPTKTGGLNYGFNNTLPQNRWEQSEKVDYAMNDSTKLSVTYTYQKEFDHHPIDTWWAPNQALPYPTPMDAHTPSRVLAVNFTKVFSPTLVNEFIGSYASYLNTLLPESTSAINPSSLGMTYQGLFGVKETQLANTLSWSNGVAEIMPNASFGGPAFSGGFGAHKFDPSLGDNISKVWGTHTLKFGAYWAQMGNQQDTYNNNAGNQGLFDFETYGGTTTNNTLADMLTGQIQSYSQSNNIMAPTNQYNQISFFAQDSWKAGRRLTINYGIRFDHVGQWYSPNSHGDLVWDPAKYSFTNTSTPDNGLVYHSIDSSVPISGWASRTFYYEPRFSAAYDLFGNAKTVLRGGAAEFYFSQGYLQDSTSSTAGQINYSTSQSLTSYAGIANITNLPTGGASVNGSTISPVSMNDTRMPHTWTYNFTVSQALPFRSVAEVSYVGSKTRDMEIGSSNNKLNDANILAAGVLFTPDPVTGVIPCVRGVSCNNPNTSDYFKYTSYSDVYVMTHGSHSTYNSLQATWTRAVKPVVVVANYTFGKVLGTFDGISGNGQDNSGTVDGTDINKNYGVESYDHTHIFNLAYSLDVPKLTHNRGLGQALNGWTLSGWTGVQSGTPLESNAAGFNVQYPSGISNQSYLGTNAINLMPNLTCDPRKNLKSGTYFNTACFSAPSPGTNGTEMWPFIHGPSVINSDMSLFKTFQLSESKRIQFRLQAYNFLNHPNSAFTVQNSGDLQLNFGTSAGQLSPTNTNTYTTGKPEFTVGNRLVELAVKFYF